MQLKYLEHQLIMIFLKCYTFVFFEETKMKDNKYNSIKQDDTDFTMATLGNLQKLEKFEFVANLC